MLRICHVDPGCGIEIPPKNWGAIEKIIWDLYRNFNKEPDKYKVDIKFLNQINPKGYDIIHCHVANLAIQLKEKNIPYIFHLHDHHVFYNGKNSYSYKENLKAIEGSLITLVPARYLVKYLNPEKCIYFSHGICLETFYPLEKNKPCPFNPKLLMIANNGLAGNSSFDRKGFVYGVGLAMLNNLEITIAGPNNNKRFFNENPWILGYPKLNLVFDLENSKLPDLYRQHDIFLNPTMLEAGHPNLTMLEAAAIGLPIIADWELETDFHGAYRAPRDIFKMDVGLQCILENWDEFRKNTLKTSINLSWEKRILDLIEIYNKFKK